MLNAGQLIDILLSVSRDTPVTVEITLEDGTLVASGSCWAEGVRLEEDGSLADHRVLVEASIDREQLLTGDALPAVSPECLRWIADHGQPLDAAEMCGADPRKGQGA